MNARQRCASMTTRLSFSQASVTVPSEKPMRKRIRRAVQSDPTNPLMLYNVACFYSVEGKTAIALDHLERAMELGMRNVDWLLTDPDLEAVRGDPRSLR
jgi:hypothetical protein